MATPHPEDAGEPRNLPAVSATLLKRYFNKGVDNGGGRSVFRGSRLPLLPLDFVVYGPRGCWALEVKNGASTTSRDLRGLRTFREDYPEAHVRLLHRGSDHLVVDGIPCLPVSEYLFGVTPGHDLP